MPSTAISSTDTDTVFVNCSFSFEVTVMLVCPLFLASTVPSAYTSAMLLSEEEYSSALLVASSGETVHCILPLFPASIVRLSKEYAFPEMTMESMVKPSTATNSTSGCVTPDMISSITPPTLLLMSEDSLPGVNACIQSTRMQAR